MSRWSVFSSVDCIDSSPEPLDGRRSRGISKRVMGGESRLRGGADSSLSRRDTDFARPVKGAFIDTDSDALLAYQESKGCVGSIM